ncbi:hypothetical protein ACGF1Z_31100 [Streptomyces sp. NPDC048018]|uniref:hypothetical protein n=1 Tax=Streptomyces sp. NPDC048018 TaxID=3365499 RepID=UPI003714E817
MANWLAGMRITALRLKVDSAETEDTNTVTTTSTTFGDTSGGPFTAQVIVPFSGTVHASLRSTHRNSSATLTTVAHLEATGSVSGSIYGASTVAALIVKGQDNWSLSLRKRFTGLVPGEILTVRGLWRVNSASTGTIDYRCLSLEGAP